MEKELINPFTYTGQSNILINLFLKNKTFSFYNCTDATIKNCSKLIQMMDGSITKENPDYYLIELDTKPNFPNCVLVDWIYRLKCSNEYIFPQNFVNYNKKAVHPKRPAKNLKIEPTLPKKESKFQYTTSFIMQAKSIQKTHKYSYKRLKKELEHFNNGQYSDLKNEDIVSFKNALQLGQSRLKCMKEIMQVKDVVDDYHKEVPSFNANKESEYSLFMKSILCGKVKHEGRWADCETRQLLFVLNVAVEESSSQCLFNERKKIDWIFVAKHVPGRTPKSCQDKYYQLLENGLVQDIETKYEEQIPFPHLVKFYQRAFLPKQEEQLHNKILNMLNDGQLITAKDISVLAIEQFYSPMNLALKSIIKKYLMRNEWPFDIDGNLNIPSLDKELEEILPLAEDFPDDLIGKYEIKSFTGSPSWTYKFMKRHDLSFRVPHYERRGAINFEEVDEFLNKMADALVKYHPKYIFNMDETFINIFNPPAKVVAPRGQATVKIEADRFDKKEGTTYLATITMDPTERVPLYIVAKGTTKACEKKYKLDKSDDEINHTKNGWTTAILMINYLKWLSDRINGKPCALLIDSYRAHKQPQVLTEAKKLNIELIFVPSCGTSIFQPLDRFVFGVLKKLRAIRFHIDDSNFKNRHKLVHEKVSEIWREMHDELIIKAWDIPELEKYLYTDPDDSKDKDYEES